ncbi:MAG: T9SS type A sorting domain-containing protein [Bacteroidota bacterium]
MNVHSKIIFFYIWYLCTLPLNGQPGFSKYFDFGISTDFHNIALVEDTVYLIGSTIDSVEERQGLVFAKLDTNGILIDSRVHLDPDGGQYAFNLTLPLVPVSDGGFLITGGILASNEYFALKLDNSGNVQFLKKYQEPTYSQQVIPWKAIELSNGDFLICSTVNLQNFKNDILVKRVSTTGEPLWEKKYGISGISESIGSLFIDENGHIILGCGRSSDVLVDPQSNVTCPRTWIFAIDGDGIVQWSNVSDPCDGGAPRGLAVTDSGDWIYATFNTAVFNLSNWGRAPKFIKKDSQFNFIWERQVAESYWFGNFIIDIAPTPDGNWIGAGNWVLPPPFNTLISDDDIHYSAGCLYKINGDGDSLWLRADTVLLDSRTTQETYVGLVVLPSGSVIAAGSFFETIPGVGSRLRAWVTKVDANGCMFEDCALTSTLVPESAQTEEVSLFPNPTSNFITIDAQKPINHIELTDMNGRILRRWPAGEIPPQIDLSAYPAGTYIVYVRIGNRIYPKRVIVQGSN